MDSSAMRLYLAGVPRQDAAAVLQDAAVYRIPSRIFWEDVNGRMVRKWETVLPPS